MPTSAQLHKLIVERLREIPHITVYDGDVPTDPPSETPGGPVLPYLVVWGLTAPKSGHTLTAAAGGYSVCTVAVTAVGGTTQRCLEAARLATNQLDGWRPHPDATPAADISPDIPTAPDTATTPVRFFVPLQFRFTSL